MDESWKKKLQDCILTNTKWYSSFQFIRNQYFCCKQSYYISAFSVLQLKDENRHIFIFLKLYFFWFHYLAGAHLNKLLPCKTNILIHGYQGLCEFGFRLDLANRFRICNFLDIAGNVKWRNEELFNKQLKHIQINSKFY